MDGPERELRGKKGVGSSGKDIGTPDGPKWTAQSICGAVPIHCKCVMGFRDYYRRRVQLVRVLNAIDVVL